jgi:hypothetical protein
MPSDKTNLELKIKIYSFIIFFKHIIILWVAFTTPTIDKTDNHETESYKTEIHETDKF